MLTPPKKRQSIDDSHSLPHKNSSDTTTTTSTASFPGKNGLGAYIASPSSFPSSRVVIHSSDFVTIHDLYPKSSIHLLCIPRLSSKSSLHPFTAFEDSAFLALVQEEVRKLRVLVAKELKRKYGRFSALEKAREAALEAGKEGDEVPAGRDWSKDVLSGIHAHPSMNHLHVHVLSRDRYSECMRHRKHYNSFATPFLIDIEDFPLSKGDVRRHPGREGYLQSDLKCWRCGKNFKNKFKALKDHLEEEFEEWKKE